MNRATTPEDPVIRSYNTEPIIQLWQERYGMDVTRFFNGMSELQLRRNAETGLEYFTPSSTAGDSPFYAVLQKEPWYYQTNKWEHQVALREMADAKKVLEVGCAAGAFLKQFLSTASSGAKAVGLELNEEAIRSARASGIDANNCPVEVFAASHASEFDAVCSFQVLEHVTQPEEFLAACSQLVRAGGLLITAVPNNASFIKHDESGFNILNMPPHHLILWTQQSLRNFLKRLGYDNIRFEFEPLQPIHVDWYVTVLAGRFERLPLPLRRILYTRPMLALIKTALNAGLRRFVRGLTMIAVARKR